MSDPHTQLPQFAKSKTHERDARAYIGALALAPFQLGAKDVEECALGMQQRDLVL